MEFNSFMSAIFMELATQHFSTRQALKEPVNNKRKNETSGMCRYHKVKSRKKKNEKQDKNNLSWLTEAQIP